MHKKMAFDIRVTKMNLHSILTAIKTAEPLGY